MRILIWLQPIALLAACESTTAQLGTIELAQVMRYQNEAGQTEILNLEAGAIASASLSKLGDSISINVDSQVIPLHIDSAALMGQVSNKAQIAYSAQEVGQDFSIEGATVQEVSSLGEQEEISEKCRGGTKKIIRQRVLVKEILELTLVASDQSALAVFKTALSTEEKDSVLTEGACRSTGRDQPGREQPGREQPGREQPGREQPGRDLPGRTIW
jgi:hypothetical protein